MKLISKNYQRQDHIAIIVFYGGRGRVSHQVAKILHENHVDIILITSIKDNPLNKYATYKIFLVSAENHYNKVSSFSTRLSLLLVFDTLNSIYFNRNYEKNLTYKLDNYQKTNKELK